MGTQRSAQLLPCDFTSNKAVINKLEPARRVYLLTPLRQSCAPVRNTGIQRSANGRIKSLALLNWENKLWTFCVSYRGHFWKHYSTCTEK